MSPGKKAVENTTSMRNAENKGTKKRTGKVLMALGLLLLASALALTGYNLWDGRRAERASAYAAERLRQQIPGAAEPALDPDGSIPLRDPDVEAPPLYMQNPDMEMPVVTVDDNAYIGLLTIPALEKELPVMSQWSYPNLKISPCRYSGSAYKGDLVIAGHNNRGHFNDLATLTQGDWLIFTDGDGNRFYYQVAELEVLKATAVEEMKSGDWDLTLFTCTFDLRARVAVRCVRVESAGR